VPPTYFPWTSEPSRSSTVSAAAGTAIRIISNAIVVIVRMAATSFPARDSIALLIRLLRDVPRDGAVGEQSVPVLAGVTEHAGDAPRVLARPLNLHEVIRHRLE